MGEQDLRTRPLQAGPGRCPPGPRAEEGARSSALGSEGQAWAHSQTQSLSQTQHGADSVQETFLKERWRQKFYGKEMGVTALYEAEDSSGTAARSTSTQADGTGSGKGSAPST